jgi:hypothetical protein
MTLLFSFLIASFKYVLLQYYAPWYERIFDAYSEIILVVILPLFILFFLLRRKKKTYHSHWNTLLAGFNYSSQEFFELVEAELYKHEVDDISTGYTNLATGGIGSDRRMYLEVEWNNLHYYICAAPFGDSFFVSAWLQNTHSAFEVLIYKIPLIGGRIHRLLFPETIYKIDTASMFMTFAHSSLMKVITEVTKDTGVRALTEEEKKPILHDVFKR